MTDFDTSNLLICATERMAYGYVYPHWDKSWPMRPSEPWLSLPVIGFTVFPFDAELRGYDTAIYAPYQQHAGRV